MAEIVYGSVLSRELKEEMKAQVDELKAEGRRVPCLAVVVAGDNAASLSYVRGKEKACAEVGIEHRLYHLKADVSQKELNRTILSCSADPLVDGVLVQLPLPEGLDEEEAILCVDPEKDVDGLHPMNFGRFFMNDRDCFVPCTPLGVMELLKRMHCNPDGKHAVVVGRSKLVGTPIARLLQNENATVTICHSHTVNLKQYTVQADILIAAVGKAKMLDASYIREGAYVIDVGVNRLDGHLCGDCDFDSMKEKAAAITPVPKGVGPMTITMLLRNTMRAYARREEHGR